MDKDWYDLMMLAKALGLTKDEVRDFIHKQRAKAKEKKPVEK
jgi:hypothetical protein